MRAPLSRDDLCWATTLPHRVAPRPTEWLPGLVLRADAANGWPAGTTARFVGHRTGHPLLGPHLNLPRLAVLLALPLSQVQATTFRYALQPAEADIQTEPLALSAYPLGPAPAFQVCPACLAEDHLLARWLALPLLRSCPQHRLLLQTHCRCGAALSAYRPGPPLACAHCHQPWADVPHVHAAPERWAEDAAILALYEAFLHQDAPLLPAALPYVLRRARPPRRPPASVATPRSLAGLVAALRAADVPAQEILDLCVSSTTAPPHCVNRACPRCGVVAAGNLERLPQRVRGADTYCTACGSLYLGAHLCQCFDTGGPPDDAYPGASSVTQAQQRVGRWRRRLALLCETMLTQDERLSVPAAFARAGLRDKPYLTVRRLGLVPLVEDYMRHQVRLLQEEGAAYWRWPLRTWHDDMAGWARQRAARDAGREHRRPGWTLPWPSNLSDAEWEALRLRLPPTLGSPYAERDVIDAILHVFGSGCVWDDLPNAGVWADAVFAYCRHWRKRGMWEALHLTLREPREPFLRWAHASMHRGSLVVR